MAENFKVGDVVELKSGGPDMTVAAVRGDGNVTCTWFNRSEAAYEVKQTVVNADALKKKS